MKGGRWLGLGLGLVMVEVFLDKLKIRRMKSSSLGIPCVWPGASPLPFSGRPPARASWPPPLLSSWPTCEHTEMARMRKTVVGPSRFPRYHSISPLTHVPLAATPPYFSWLHRMLSMIVVSDTIIPGNIKNISWGAVFRVVLKASRPHLSISLDLLAAEDPATAALSFSSLA